MSEQMTIAQALRRVKKLKGLIAEHKANAVAGVSYISDKIPAFRYLEEEAEMNKAIAELIDLESKIAIANATATVTEEGVSIALAKAIRMLQEIKGQISFYHSLPIRTGVEKTRVNEWDDCESKMIWRNVETTYISDLSEKDRSNVVKALQDRFEVLNNLVEDANHKVII